MRTSEQIDQLAKALAQAQGEMKNPPLDGHNPHYNSRFATLAGVRDAVLPVLARHGLAVIQSAGAGERGPTLTTLLMHASGQWIETDALSLPAVKQDPQGHASALSYCRRYALMTLVGVVGDDDDDGEAAAQPSPKRKAEAAPPAPAPAAAKQDGTARPRDGAELEMRLKAKEAELVAAGRCKAGELITYLKGIGDKCGYVPEIVRWPVGKIESFWPWVIEQVQTFQKEHPRPAPAAVPQEVAS